MLRPKAASRTVRVAALSAALMALAACRTQAPAAEVRPGMSETRVVQILGAPPRTAVLVGKELRALADLPVGADPGQYRLVYIYERSGLLVWFKDGQVTGVTRGGVAVR